MREGYDTFRPRITDTKNGDSLKAVEPGLALRVHLSIFCTHDSKNDQLQMLSSSR